MDTNIKYYWIDYIRLIATFGVILLHSAAPLLYKYNTLSEYYWMTGNIYDSIVRMSVPLFFMISGFLLLNKHESLWAFFTKRIFKVVLPLIVWSIIYIFWRGYYELDEGVSIYQFFFIALRPAYYHLWFLYAIIGIYLFLPILRVIISNSDKIILYYYVVLWFFAVSIIPLGEKITGLHSRIDLLSISGFSGYLVLGLILGNLTISKRLFLSAISLFVISSIITIFGTYILTINNNGGYVGYFYGYLSPNVILMSAGAFVIIKYVACELSVFSNQKLLQILHSLSSASFGIYLIHAMYLFLLKEGDLGFVMSAFVGEPIYTIPLTAIMTFILSYISIYLLKKIPIVTRIVP